MAEKSDLEKATEGGAEHISKQQAKAAADAAAEQARRDSVKGEYPIDHGPGGGEDDLFTYTTHVLGYYTEEEAQAKIDETRGAGNFVGAFDKGAFIEKHDNEYWVAVEENRDTRKSKSDHKDGR